MRAGTGSTPVQSTNLRGKPGRWYQPMGGIGVSSGSHDPRVGYGDEDPLKRALCGFDSRHPHQFNNVLNSTHASERLQQIRQASRELD